MHDAGCVLLVELLVAFACDHSNPSSTSPRSGAPGTVADLAVDSNKQSTATLSFTEVDNGARQLANYDVRFATSAGATWATATSVTQGTCASRLAGTPARWGTSSGGWTERRWAIYDEDPAPAQGISQVKVHPVWGGVET